MQQAIDILIEVKNQITNKIDRITKAIERGTLFPQMERAERDGYRGALSIVDKEISRIQALGLNETLEEIIEDIGKRMCHAGLLYPNAGYWNLQDKWGWECKRETLIEVYKEFREELKRNGHYD